MIILRKNGKNVITLNLYLMPYCQQDTGCPNKNGNRHDDFFVPCGIIKCKHYFVVSQLKRLTLKTTSLGITKMWSTIFQLQN